MTALEAEDEVFAIFKTIWDETGFEARYPDVPGKKPATEESVDQPWARPTMNHVDGGQSSLAGEVGTRRFTDLAVFTVQVFAPIGDGKTKLRELAQLVKDGLRDARPTGVWLRNPRMRDTQGDGAFNQMNVIVDVSYDDVR